MAWPNSNDARTAETERLFGDSVPSVVPVSTTSSSQAQHLHQQQQQQRPASVPPPAQQQQQPLQHQQQPLHAGVPLGGGGPNQAAPPSAIEGGFWVENTLDESVWATLSRDVVTIGRNLRSVLIPLNWDFNAVALHNWDLWGPLIFMLSLAITLSVGERKPSDVFALVFTEVALGAVVLTVNVVLLGGNIVFFQSLCLIGYCLFPIVVAAIICTLVKLSWARTLVLVVCLGWASWATVPFIGKTVSQQRRALAVYPVLLMYVSIGWLALVKS